VVVDRLPAGAAATAVTIAATHAVIPIAPTLLLLLLAFALVALQTPLPSADMALSSEEYARTVCALLDVPVHGASVIPSLHTLFSLYTEFRDNAHFAKLGAAATAAGGAAAAARAAAFADVDALVEGKDSS